MSKWQYYIVARETNDFIDCFDTEEEARAEIKKYEEADKKDGIYEENFYDVFVAEFL